MSRLKWSEGGGRKEEIEREREVPDCCVKDFDSSDSGQAKHTPSLMSIFNAIRFPRD